MCVYMYTHISEKRGKMRTKLSKISFAPECKVFTYVGSIYLFICTGKFRLVYKVYTCTLIILSYLSYFYPYFLSLADLSKLLSFSRYLNCGYMHIRVHVPVKVDNCIEQKTYLVRTEIQHGNFFRAKKKEYANSNGNKLFQ